MRPAGRGELESLYFEYPGYSFRRPPEMDGNAIRHRVAIVGAGPVGLAAALELARRGIPCVLLDNKNTLNDGSRAICISRYSLETLQQLGVAERFVSKALGWTHGRCYFRDQMIYQLQMPHSQHERFFPMYNLQQQYIEKFLVDKAEDYPGMLDLRWQSRVTAVRNEAEGVVLTVDTPEGQYTLEADYLLAADGGKSEVRKSLGLRMNGKNLPGHYVIADVRMHHDFPTERRSFFESEANPDSTILVHKQPDDIWRVDWQLLPGDDPDEAIREETIRRRVGRILDMIGYEGDWELEWWSIYTANTLCLDAYKHGRVLFIGDAAHIVPIFGVRGLNNGIADAVNAAWKLAYVLQGKAPDSLLESYDPERRGATFDVFRSAGKSSRFMTPPTRGYALMRRAVLELSLSQEFTRRFADPRQVQPYTYSQSPLTSQAERDAEFDEGPHAGAAAINRKLGEGQYLLDDLGGGFSGIYFAAADGVPEEIDSLWRELKSRDPDFELLVVSRGDCEKASSGRLLRDSLGEAFLGYGAQDGTFYLLRPDRHVAARWLSARVEEILKSFEIALGGTSER